MSDLPKFNFSLDSSTINGCGMPNAEDHEDKLAKISFVGEVVSLRPLDVYRISVEGNPMVLPGARRLTRERTLHQF